MAVLDDTNRGLVRNHFMRVVGTLLPSILKSDVRAAVDATDQWIEDNSAAFNTALPVTFRTNASLTQKTLLFCFVAMRRAGLLRVQEDA